MKLTIVADDKRVGVDDLFFDPVELPHLDPAIHALQWYGEYGEIEFKTVFANGALIKPQNQLITDITPYQFAIDAWNATKAAAEQVEVLATIPVTEV